MNIIDAIEGNAKAIISGLHQVFVEYRLEDAEYARNVKAVLEATASFIQNNKEIIDNPQTLLHVLYAYSKELWMDHLKKEAEKAPADEEGGAAGLDMEYCEYYYDYIYHHGMYPR